MVPENVECSYCGANIEVRTYRKNEWMLFCLEQEAAEFNARDGWFDKELNYHFDNRPNGSSISVWEWSVWPEIVRYAEEKGISIPEDVSIDLSKTY